MKCARKNNTPCQKNFNILNQNEMDNFHNKHPTDIIQQPLKLNQKITHYKLRTTAVNIYISITKSQAGASVRFCRDST